jgi:hypothetical protein
VCGLALIEGFRYAGCVAPVLGLEVIKNFVEMKQIGD